MKTPNDLKNMLLEEVAEGTEKGRQFVKKYNLKPFYFEELLRILMGYQNTTTILEVYQVLRDFGFKIKKDGKEWRIE